MTKDLRQGLGDLHLSEHLKLSSSKRLTRHFSPSALLLAFGLFLFLAPALHPTENSPWPLSCCETCPSTSKTGPLGKAMSQLGKLRCFACALPQRPQLIFDLLRGPYAELPQHSWSQASSPARLQWVAGAPPARAASLATDRAPLGRSFAGRLGAKPSQQSQANAAFNPRCSDHHFVCLANQNSSCTSCCTVKFMPRVEMR